MAVDKGLLWETLGLWGVLWVVTVAAGGVALLVLLVSPLLAWRRRRRTPQVPDLPFFLDELDAIAICEGGGYGAVAKQQVEEYVETSKDSSAAADGRWFKGGWGRTEGSGKRKSYDVHATANAVMGIVAKALEDRNGIVHADLRDQTMVGDAAWRRTRSRRLRRVDTYVSLMGEFQLASGVDGKTVLVADIGASGRRVRVECDDRSLRRDEIPQGVFSGRCFGKFESWRPDSGEVVIRPVAFFQ